MYVLKEKQINVLPYQAKYVSFFYIFPRFIFVLLCLFVSNQTPRVADDFKKKSITVLDKANCLKKQDITR